MANQAHDTGFFCPSHVEVATKIEGLTKEQEGLQKSNEAAWKRIDEHSATISKLNGYYEGAIPGIQKDIGKLEKAAKDTQGEVETAKTEIGVYSGEVRRMEAQVGEIQDSLSSKASKEDMQREIDKLATKESVANTLTWVRAGWLAIAVAILLMIANLVSMWWLNSKAAQQSTPPPKTAPGGGTP